MEKVATTDVDVPDDKSKNPVLVRRAGRESVAGGMGSYDLWKLNQSTWLQASNRQGNFQISLRLAYVIVIDLKNRNLNVYIKTVVTRKLTHELLGLTVMDFVYTI